MGDCGALFIGFTLSSLTILEHYVSPASSTVFPVLMPVLVLAVPLIDTISVVVIRLREGRPISLTVNGVAGEGGGFGGAAPSIVDGMLYVGSGYAILNGKAGNVLLAFGPAED